MDKDKTIPVRFAVAVIVGAFCRVQNVCVVKIFEFSKTAHPKKEETNIDFDSSMISTFDDGSSIPYDCFEPAIEDP